MATGMLNGSNTYLYTTVASIVTDAMKPYDNGTIRLYENIEYDNSTELDNPFPKNMLGFTAVCAFIIAILGSVGNIITILSLMMSKKLRTPTTAYVINLAVAELLFCLIILPISGAQYAYLKLYAQSWLTDNECISFAVIRYTLTQAELQTIVAIAFTRATAVGCPRFYQRVNTKPATTIYIACIWVYSFALKLPTGLGIFGSYKFNPKTMECDMANDILSKLSRLVSLIVEVLIPVLTIFILYIYIFVKVRKSSLRVGKAAKIAAASRSSGGAKPSEEDITETESESRFKILKRKFSDNSMKLRFSRRSSSVTTATGTNRRDIRLARTIFTIFVVILLCSVPVAVIHGVDYEARNKVRFLGVHILYWVQYCLNMVIYVIMNKQYRDAYIDFFAKIVPSCQKHKGFVFPWEAPSMTSKAIHGFSSGSFKKGSVKRNQISSLEAERSDALLQDRLPAIQEVNSSIAYMESDVSENLQPQDNPPNHIPEILDDVIRNEEREKFIQNKDAS